MRYILGIIFCFVMFGLIQCVGDAYAEEPCYKDAPAPIFDPVKGYGYVETVPCNKPTNKWNILKEWRTDNGNSREVFVDTDKDGECNVVIHFAWNGKYTEDGRKVFSQLPSNLCPIVELYIKEFLHERGDDD